MFFHCNETWLHSMFQWNRQIRSGDPSGSEVNWRVYRGIDVVFVALEMLRQRCSRQSDWQRFVVSIVFKMHSLQMLWGIIPLPLEDPSLIYYAFIVSIWCSWCWMILRCLGAELFIHVCKYIPFFSDAFFWIRCYFLRRLFRRPKISFS